MFTHEYENCKCECKNNPHCHCTKNYKSLSYGIYEPNHIHQIHTLQNEEITPKITVEEVKIT